MTPGAGGGGGEIRGVHAQVRRWVGGGGGDTGESPSVIPDLRCNKL